MKKIDPRISYAVAGAIFGLCFPVIATIIDVLVQGTGLSIGSLIQAQKDQPLHWVIDSAPIFLGLFAYAAGVRQFSVQELNQNLEYKVQLRTEQLKEQNEELQTIQNELENSLHNISQSINYAKRLQTAFLKSVDELVQEFPGSFVYYRPRDIVSGDFPFYLNHNGYSYIASVDCTGHGVPGAMLSIIGHFLLTRVINELAISDTGEILTELDAQMKGTLGQKGMFDVQDGMDMSLVRIDRSNGMVQFSAAASPVYRVSEGKVHELKGDPYSIGGFNRKKQIQFNQEELQFNEGDCLFLFTDGISDQFTDDGTTKFGYTRIKDLVGMSNSKNGLEKRITDGIDAWGSGVPQLDDKMLIGLHL